VKTQTKSPPLNTHLWCECIQIITPLQQALLTLLALIIITTISSSPCSQLSAPACRQQALTPPPQCGVGGSQLGGTPLLLRPQTRCCSAPPACCERAAAEAPQQDRHVKASFSTAAAARHLCVLTQELQAGDAHTGSGEAGKAGEAGKKVCAHGVRAKGEGGQQCGWHHGFARSLQVLGESCNVLTANIERYMEVEQSCLKVADIGCCRVKCA
jgi:hypothetical protein